MTTADGRSCALIPGISTSREDPHSFIQYIDGYTGKTAYLRFPLNEFSSRDRPFAVEIKNSSFQESGILARSHDGSAEIEGHIQFGLWTPYPSGFLKPGIMGPFGLPGFLECYHGVVSAGHDIAGKLRVKAADFETDWDFTGGRGYIEKDWGHSFPKDYVWLQANQFADPALSVFLSLAAIPFRGRDFPGLIAFVHLEGRGFITFATWNAARLRVMEITETEYHVVLTRSFYSLEIRAVQTAAGCLQAPARGTMDRVIKESVDGQMDFSLSRRGRILASGFSRGAGLEQGGNPQRLAGWFLSGMRDD